MAAASALELGRRMFEEWNGDRLDLLFDTFDEDIVARLDPSWPERSALGDDAVRSFYRGMRDAMGAGGLVVEEEHDLGDRAFWRVRQDVHSASGVNSSYSWSLLLTARLARVVMVEFFIDDALLRADLGI